MEKTKPLEISPQALFRYQAVSAVHVRLLAGMGLSQAVREVASQRFPDWRNQPRSLSERSLYRWLDAYKREGLPGLQPQLRSHVAESVALPPKLLDFLRAEKQADPEVSVPELLLRARLRGVLAEDDRVSRVSVWRACRRMGLPLGRVRKLVDRDMRPFQYPNRMLMVLADGKHFRAGSSRLRRVALHFLDDATRYGLGVVVGTSESTELFLQGLHQTIRRYGLMKALYLDRGPGFISDDTCMVVARLGIKLIHGTAAYPQGHGKIERFHWTLIQHQLRTWDQNPEIDPAPSALALRLSHWLDQVYNHAPHEALGQPPYQRWQSDPRPLEFPPDIEWFHDQFLLSYQRHVSHDNLVPYENVDYELPRGYAGQMVSVTRHLLDGTLSIVHEGRRLVLHPTNRNANAYCRRGRQASSPPAAPDPPPQTAASLAFDADFQPLVDDEGNYWKGQDND
jgi:transposase InsO family protein